MADPLVKVDGIAGATDLGDGRVVLILDLPRRWRGTRRGARPRGEAAARCMSATANLHPVHRGRDRPTRCRSRDVAHIEMVEQVTAVPNAAPSSTASCSRAARSCPALNLRARFGFERAPYDLRTRLLVVQRGRPHVGLVVDARARVRDDRPGGDPAAGDGADRAERPLSRGVANSAIG